MNLKITSYNQIDSISLFIKTSSGIQEVEFKGNNGINTFRNIFNNLETKYNGGASGNLPKKIVIDDRTIDRSIDRVETPKSTKRPTKKPQTLPEIEDLGIEEIEDLEEVSISNPNEINLNRSNVMNLNYSIPTSGEMTPAQSAKLMASQSGLSFR